MKTSIVRATAALFLFGTSTFASAQTIATWNIAGGLKSAEGLRDAAEIFADEIGDIDILVLQEVIETDQVAAVAEQLGYRHWVISDFSPPVAITDAWFKSLEVAVLSRIPLTSAVEWDLTGQNNGDGYKPRAFPEDTYTSELALEIDLKGTSPSRGFLRADLLGGWSVYAVHWKSSNGNECNAADIDNAAQREAQARGVIADANNQLAAGQTVIVAGDFNTNAPNTTLRVGTDLNDDCTPMGSCAGVCGQGLRDGYDDAIATLATLDPTTGRLLSQDLPRTFLNGNFSNFAIDHIFVAGPKASVFAAAQTPEATDDNFAGSDHRPVIAGPPLQMTASPMAAASLDPLSAADALLPTDRVVKEAKDVELMELIQDLRERLIRIEELVQSR